MFAGSPSTSSLQGSPATGMEYADRSILVERVNEGLKLIVKTNSRGPLVSCVAPVFEDLEQNGSSLDDSMVNRICLALQPVLGGALHKSDSISSNLSSAAEPQQNQVLAGQGEPQQPSSLGMTAQHQHPLHAALLQADQRVPSWLSTEGEELMFLDRTDSGRSSAGRAPSLPGNPSSSSQHAQQHNQFMHHHQHTQSEPAGSPRADMLPPGIHTYNTSSGQSHPPPPSSIGTAGSRDEPSQGESAPQNQAASDAGPADLLASLVRSASMCDDDTFEFFGGHQTVDNIMNTPVHVVHKDADLAAAKLLMSRCGVSGLLVDTGTDTPGFVTKRDFLKFSFAKTLKNAKVSDVMTHPVIAINSGTSLRDAVLFLAAKGLRRAPVIDPTHAKPGQPLSAYVGVVSDTDVFRVLSQSNDGRACSNGGASDQQGQNASPAGDRHSGALNRIHHYKSNISSVSGYSVNSLAHSISSLSEQAKNISTEDRLSAAAALWELDFSELEVTRKIGVGSFGEVLLASFRGTKVAVKRMRGFEMTADNDEPGPSPTMMPVFAQFFEREIEIMASIRHPNVVNFIGACHTPPNVCLVTEYCARGSLDHLLHKSGLHLDLVKKVEFAMDIARGMSCLHAQRPAIIHRDLKPANLLVSARFEVKVADFGLSRIKDHAQLINSRAGLEGTVEYCAPEVLRGEPYTEKCDCWSYGVVLWELLNRQRPYADTDSPVYILMMALGTGSMRLPAVKEEVATPGLVKLVDKCMAWQPADRPSFREILHFLENEYKTVRGKAAAVPRSDSASSMVVLGTQVQHSESAADVAARQAGSSSTAAAAQRSQPHAIPAMVAHALSGGIRVPSSLITPRRGMASANGDGSTSDTSGSTLVERHSAHVASRFGPARNNSQNMNIASPQGAASRPNGIASASKQGRPPRHPHARMSRARSTPLPANVWFQDPSDAWDDTDEPCAADDNGTADCPQGNPAVSESVAEGKEAHGTAPPALTLPSAARLANIPETGSWHDGMETGSTIVESLQGACSSGLQSPDTHLSTAHNSGTNASTSSGSVFPSSQHNSRQDGQADIAQHDHRPSFDIVLTNGTSPAVQVPKPLAFASPFDGFLPFSDEPMSPDTPRIQSPHADLVNLSADMDLLDASKHQTPGNTAVTVLHSKDTRPSLASSSFGLQSPFSAYANLESSGDPQEPPLLITAGTPGVHATVSAPHPTQHRTGNFASPFAQDSSTTATEDSLVASAAETQHKTGNFHSPFAQHLPPFDAPLSSQADEIASSAHAEQLASTAPVPAPVVPTRKTGNFFSPFAQDADSSMVQPRSPSPVKSGGHRTGNFRSPFAQDTTAEHDVPAAHTDSRPKTGNFYSPFAQEPVPAIDAFSDGTSQEDKVVDSYSSLAQNPQASPSKQSNGTALDQKFVGGKTGSFFSPFSQDAAPFDEAQNDVVDKQPPQGKTGSFFSPFAAEPDQQVPTSAAEQPETTQTGGKTGSFYSPFASDVPQSNEGDVPEVIDATGWQQPAYESQLQTNASPTKSDKQGGSSMSMCLSMDASGTTTQLVRIDQSHSQNSMSLPTPVATVTALHSPEYTPGVTNNPNGTAVTVVNQGITPDQLEMMSAGLPIVLRRSSFTATRGGVDAHTLLQNSNSHRRSFDKATNSVRTQLQNPSQHHSEKSSAGSSPESLPNIANEGDVTVHQTAWVKV